jgi:type I restriction enzyme S subunit
VKLTLIRAGNTTETQEKVDASALADDLEIPSSLVGIRKFVRLSEIAEVAKGPTGIKDAKPGPYPLVVTAEDRGSCDHYDFEGEAILIPTVSSTGHGDASLKRIHYQEGRFAVGSILAAVQVRDRASHSARFLYEYLSVFKDELLVARMSGTANVSLTVKKIEGVPIPLIPIAQQQHLHDLMRLCDALEAKGRLAAEQHARLLGTLLGTLTDSSTPDELAANWQRVADHFDLLFDRPEAVDALEQTVLQLAVRGLLVRQEGDDAPAQELSVKIQRRRKSKRKITPLDSDAVAEAGVELPSGWTWCSVDEVSADEETAITDGPFGANLKTEHYIEAEGFRVVRLQNIGEGRFRDEHRAYIDEERFSRLRRHAVFPGDIVVAGLVDESIRCCIVPVGMGPAIVKADCYRFAVHEDVDAEYLCIYLSSETAHQFASAHHHGLTLTRIGLGNFRSIPVPLPPANEQRRIVARVAKLRRLCSDLRQRLSSNQITQAHLAEALVDEVA